LTERGRMTMVKLGYQTNTWGGVIGAAGGVTSVKEAYYWANGSTEEAIAQIAAAGYSGFELFEGNLMSYESNPEQFKALCTKYNMSFIGVYTGGNLIYPDILEDEFYKIRRVAQFAASLGAEQLVIGGGAIRAAGIQDSDYERLADALNKLDQLAAELGLKATYHPHLGTIVQNWEQLQRIMSLTSISLCPDTAHLEAGGCDPVKVVETYKDRIPYIHFKDLKGSEFVPLGQGQQNFEAMLDILMKNGYSGWITTELDSYPDPKAGAQLSYSYLQKLLQTK